MDGNAELVAAMKAMADEPGDQAWRALFDALGRSTLTVPLRVVDGAPTDEVLMALDGDDNAILPAFTDEDALARWTGTPVPYARIAAPQVAQMALGGGGATVALNPADAFGGQFGRPDLEALAAGLTRAGAPDESGGGLMSAPAGTQFRVATKPPSVPEATMTSLRDALGGLPGVRALWLFTGAYGEDEDHLFVGVETDPDAPVDRDETMRALAAALGPALPSGVPADILPLDTERLEFVRHAAVEVSAPAER